MINSKFDSKIFFSIIKLLKDEGYDIDNIGTVTHLGNNVFKMDLCTTYVPLSGHGGTYIITLEDNKLKVLEVRNQWMS